MKKRYKKVIIMKKTLFMLVLAALSVAMCSCKGDPFDYLPPDSSPSLVYRGDLSSSDGNTFYSQNSLVEVSLLRDTLYVFTMHDMAFTEQSKPVNLKISGVCYWQDGANSFFTADGIVPTAGSSKRPEYTVRNLDANIYKGILSLNMKCGEFDVTFSGTQVLE